MEVLRNIQRQITILIIVVCSGSTFSQERILSVDESYVLLDDFLARPTPETAKMYRNTLASWKPEEEEGQLAKVVGLCNLAHFETQFFDFPKAISSYEKAKLLFPANAKSRYDIVEFCYKPLGNLYTKINALEEAESLIKEYILLAQNDKLVDHEVAGLKNLSVVYQNKGSFKRAISVLQQGLKLEPNDVGLQLNLATNYLGIGEYGRAEILVNRLLEHESVPVNAYQLKSNIQWERGDKENAIASLRMAFEVLSIQKGVARRDMAKMRLSMAELEAAIGNKSTTLEYLRMIYALLIPDYSLSQRLPKQNQLFAENTLIDALDLHARILTRENRQEEALEAYDLAFDVSEQLENPSLLQDSKLLQKTNWKIRSEKCIDLLFALYSDDNSNRWIEKALQIDARSKSLLVEEERAWRAQLMTEDTSELALLIRENRRKLALVNTQITNIAKIEGDAGTKLLQLQSNYNDLISEHRDLSLQFQKVHGQARYGKDLSLEAILSQVQTKEETLVSYFLGNDNLYQWIVNAEGIQFNKLTTTETDVSVLLQYYKNMISFFENSSLIANDPASFVSASFMLYEALHIPICKKLVVVPDGVLGYIPFSTLLMSPLQTVNFEDMPFLIKKTELSYNSSLNEYINSPMEEKETPNVLGVFPVFKGSSRELTYSIQEAEGISNAVSTTLLMEEEATSYAFLQKQKSFNTLHISTHANGGTFTNPAAIQFDDRLLSVNELYGYDFNKDLVVLSACETGVGAVIKGEGALSVARAFQYTGTKSVIFSLWAVNDLSTSMLMTDFYRDFSKSKTPHRSLRKAQLNYLKNDNVDNSKKSPYYWAAFVHYGDSTFQSSNSWWIYLIGVLCTTALIFIIKAHFAPKKFDRNS